MPWLEFVRRCRNFRSKYSRRRCRKMFLMLDSTVRMIGQIMASDPTRVHDTLTVDSVPPAMEPKEPFGHYGPVGNPDDPGPDVPPIVWVAVGAGHLAVAGGLVGGGRAIMNSEEGLMTEHVPWGPEAYEPTAADYAEVEATAAAEQAAEDAAAVLAAEEEVLSEVLAALLL
jgi:hypothetical protein